MAETANRFLQALSPELRAKAQFPFDDEERFFFHYIPSDDFPKAVRRSRMGLTLREMTPQQKHLASALLSAGLSQAGYIKATTIMSLEEVLRAIEGDSGDRRNPEKYHFSIFGKPAEKGVWGYRVEGHHVSLHFTVIDGVATGNPTFFGSNPAEVRSGPFKGLRVLANEEDRARALLESMTPEQKKLAIVDAKAYRDILTAASRRAALDGKPSGLHASKMTVTQKRLLDALIAEYIDNVPAELAEQRRTRLKSANGEIWFAWAGVEQRGGPHYYRVQTPAFLIEYDNTQNQANHVHSVWRDFQGDWGEDLLKRHYRTSPATHGHDAKPPAH
ncbi:MAG TPA: DUF3500 domain-containing protein [Bryobacteraceae bacterium]|nr:DUF3500 domain-containing protein [Bryobacteraceae bacterium]